MRGTEAPRPGARVDLRSPRGYYVDLSRSADPGGPTDAAGLPLARGPGAEETHSPVDVARFGLGNLEIYLRNGNGSRRERFEAAVRWLVENAEEIPGGFVGWPMPGVPAAYRASLASGWFSGAAHGACLSVLARASALLGLEGALETAARAVGGFTTPVEDGGFMREVGEGGHEGGLDSMMMIEEYPMAARPSVTLTGHVVALWGLFDYANVSGEVDAEVAFDRGVRGLAFELHRYDLGYWTRHDLDEHWRGIKLADLSAIVLQTLGLRVLAAMTTRQEFSDTADRWAAYASGHGNRWRARAAGVRFGLLNPGSRAL